MSVKPKRGEGSWPFRTALRKYLEREDSGGITGYNWLIGVMVAEIKLTPEGKRWRMIEWIADTLDIAKQRPRQQRSPGKGEDEAMPVVLGSRNGS